MTRTLDKPVLIAGGGIGGLATALALARHGIASHVLERRSVFAEDGAGIQIGPNGSRILEEIRALDHVEALAGQPGGLAVHEGQTGAFLTELPLGAWMMKRYGAPYLTAHRQDLHQALLLAAQSTGGITITFDAEVTGAVDREGAVVATLGNGREYLGAALICADGVRSQLRRGICPAAAAPNYAGKCAYRAVVAASALPAGFSNDNVHIWLSPGAHVVHYPVRGGRETAIVAIFEDKDETTGWSTAVEAGTVKARARALAPQVRALLDQPGDWRKWALVELSMPAQWNSGRQALLGDAAHPVLPFLAQGAVMALEDAMTVAYCLSQEGDDIPGALERYRARRRNRCLRVQSASLRNGRIYHLSGFLGRARDGVLKSTPPAMLMAQYDWLYGWKAPAA